MPPLVPTPFDQRIQRVQKRLKRQDDPRTRQKTRQRLQGLRGRQFFSQQRNRPPAPLPFSGAFETTVSGLEKTREQRLSDIAGRRLATQQQFGFEDQSNPFARAAMLQRQFQQQQARTLNQAARTGQLFAGSFGRARERDVFESERGLDEALREFQAELGGLSREELAAQTDFTEGLTAAQTKRLEQALKDRPTPEEAPPRPPAAQAFLKSLQKRAKRKETQGKAGTKRRRRGKRKAADIRERLQRLRETPLG